MSTRTVFLVIAFSLSAFCLPASATPSTRALFETVQKAGKAAKRQSHLYELAAGKAQHFAGGQSRLLAARGVQILTKQRDRATAARGALASAYSVLLRRLIDTRNISPEGVRMKRMGGVIFEAGEAAFRLAVKADFRFLVAAEGLVCRHQPSSALCAQARSVRKMVQAYTLAAPKP